MVAGTLYTYLDNFRSAKALIAAKYAKADVKIAPNFIFGETNKSKEFLKKFPAGKVPAFESSTGELLQDSNAIAYYIANEQLRGTDDFNKSQILQWIFFAESEILAAACTWVFPVLGILKDGGGANSQEAINRAKTDLKSSLNILNNYLLTKTYLVGERITLADIIVACNLLNPYRFVMDPNFRKPFGNVNRWFLTLINQPEFKEVLGEVILCNKVAQINTNTLVESACKRSISDDKKLVNNEDNKNNSELFTQKSNKKKGKKPKDEKQQKKEKAKKEQGSSGKATEPVEELDAADALLAAEPKSKDPFESLPKGTFNIDDFKRFYSNEDESKSIPYFWDKFDKENYSIWYGEYKYANELTKVFMSCNLITGMFQRLDKMRKQAFASVCLFGEDNNSTISGIWVWRGQELAFTLSPDWQIDYETYEWKKLDPNSATTKDLVKQYFSWTGADKDGRKFNQGKIFK